MRYDAALAEGGPVVRSFWSQTVITYGGFTLSSELLVIPMTVGIITGGAKLLLRGNTIGGAAVGFSSLFGVGTDLSAPLDPGTSMWQWASAELTAEGINLGPWVHLDNVTRFTRTNGFAYSRFDIYFEPDSWPLSLLMTVRVLSEQETFALTTLFDLDPAVLYLYANPSGLRGLSLQYIEITDQLTLGGILALSGGLYKTRGADDIDLRARNYYIDIALKDSVRYERTDYDTVVSLEGKSAEITFAGDLYFALGNPVPTLLTGEVSLEIGLSKNIAFHAGLAVSPLLGLREFMLLAEFWFSAL